MEYTKPQILSTEKADSHIMSTMTKPGNTIDSDQHGSQSFTAVAGYEADE